VLEPEGARDATSRIRSIVALGTGVGRNARTARRVVIAASTAAMLAVEGEDSGSLTVLLR